MNRVEQGYLSYERFVSVSPSRLPLHARARRVFDQGRQDAVAAAKVGTLLV